MVFPVGDDNSDRRSFPFVTIALIIANVFVFVVLQGMGSNEDFTMAYVQVPREILTGQDIELEPSLKTVHTPQGDVQVTDPGLRKTPIPPWMTLLTAIFMHGSIMHLLGNMWFLWIFGDNIEDDMGHVKYLFFYVVTGVIASLVFVALNSSGEASLTPCLGASGAISGVLGAYLVLHPQRRVSVLLMRMMIDVPGYVAVGIWFLFQWRRGLLGPHRRLRGGHDPRQADELRERPRGGRPDDRPQAAHDRRPAVAPVRRGTGAVSASGTT
jgi:membrane associated rhomboid family serine protease